MKFSHFFVDRPRFATVISCLILLIGMLSYFSLPVAQYPEIAPPQVQVSASYPGATAETIAETVATPLEQQINGVEGMLYMSSQATGTGSLAIDVTFEPGTNLDTAQVLVQNRVAAALPRLPEEVRRRGVTTIKSSPNFLIAINLYSPNGTHDLGFIGNYASLKINERLKRLDGVSSSLVFGASQYAMRLWLDPDRMAALDLTAEEVLAAVRTQNTQVAGGTLNQQPLANQGAFELAVQTQGRLIDPEEFEEIIVKTGEGGALVRLKDIARAELGSESYTTRGYLGERPSVVLALFAQPGSNSLDAADSAKQVIADLSLEFPEDLEYKIIYNPTQYIEESIDEVFKTLLITITLVVLVIVVFLQSLRTAIIPVVTIPISLIGTFGLMLMFGYSLNMLTLFGLVLAIGIVVDDAIVVVENVERRLRDGMPINEATKRTMDDVGSALIATSLVLVSVFLPTLLLDGISGQFYKQFGVVIAAATVLSTIVSLTLSPAMAAFLMKNFDGKAENTGLFNRVMDKISDLYGRFVASIVRMTFVSLTVYVCLIGTAGWLLVKIPTGFIPPQDQGYAITILNLPPGSSLDRTDAVVRKATKALLALPDVEDTVAFTGFSAATFSNASNAGAIFAVLKPLDERRHIDAIIADMRGALFQIDEGLALAVPPPPVPGVGNADGFRMMVQDRAGLGPAALEQAVWMVAGAANQAPETTSVFSLFENGTPRVYLDVDRERARQLDVPLEGVFNALQLHFGGAYVNDFNLFGRTYRVSAQADEEYRLTRDDILRLRVRNASGDMVPLGSIATVKDVSGPSRVPRYNLYPAAGIIGNAAPGFSSGQSLARMEQLADDILPEGFGYEWTDLAYQEKATGNTAIWVFALAVLFVFLLLSAQYESWTLPLSIILIVPMCLLSAGLGLFMVGTDNNVITQIGLIVLVGLASKNAILIVEFAKQNEEVFGMDRWTAAVEAARRRLRPILMTSFSFILGVVPLLLATGAGFEMRRAIGVTVFSGMIGVTAFGLIFTPVFYVLCRGISGASKPAAVPAADAPAVEVQQS